MSEKIPMKIRAQMFLERNMGTILAIGTQVVIWGSVILGGTVIVKNAKREEEKRKAEKAAREAEERAEFFQKMKEEWEAKKNDPKNQLTDGGFLTYDGLYEPDCPGAECDEVPLESMGQFGEDIRNRYKENFPDWEEIGMPDPEKLAANISIALYEKDQSEETREEDAA